MTRIASLVLLTLGVLAAPAAAKPADPFETFVASLATDPKAAATRYHDCKLLLAPSGEARTPCTLSAADLVGAPSGVTFAVKRLAYKDLAKSTVEYLDADVEARAGAKVVAQFHVVEIGGMGPPDGDFAPTAVHWARVIPDKDVAARAKAKTLPAAPAIAKRVVPLPAGTDEQVASDRDQGIEAMENTLGSEGLKDTIAGIAEDGVVWGSAAGQRWTGKSGARAIRAWKLELIEKGDIAAAGNDLVVCGAVDILDLKRGVTYAALVVMSMQMEPTSGDHLWSARMVSFAIPQ